MSCDIQTTFLPLGTVEARAERSCLFNSMMDRLSAYLYARRHYLPCLLFVVLIAVGAWLSYQNRTEIWKYWVPGSYSGEANEPQYGAVQYRDSDSNYMVSYDTTHAEGHSPKTPPVTHQEWGDCDGNTGSFRGIMSKLDVYVTVAWVVARSKTGVSVLMSTNEIFVQDLRWLPIHDGLHLHKSVYV